MSNNNKMLNDVIAELQKTCRKWYYKPERIQVYAEPKCPYCDKARMIHAKAPNGQELIDECFCSERKKYVWVADPFEVSAYVLTEQDGLAVVIPSKVDRNEAVLMSWWVDPNPEDSEFPFSLLENSLFTTEEKFKDFCLKAGLELYPESLDVV